MEKIASFTVNHLTLRPGVYVSRKDHVGAEVVTTFDLRMTAPNLEPVLNTAEVHSIERSARTAGCIVGLNVVPSLQARECWLLKIGGFYTRIRILSYLRAGFFYFMQHLLLCTIII